MLRKHWKLLVTAAVLSTSLFAVVHDSAAPSPSYLASPCIDPYDWFGFCDPPTLPGGIAPTPSPSPTPPPLECNKYAGCP